jgi:hypothetical protein
MEPDRAGRKGIRAHERFRGSGKETLREDLLSPPLRDNHVANDHGHSGHSHAHNRATTPNGHAQLRATTATPTLGRRTDRHFF